MRRLLYRKKAILKAKIRYPQLLDISMTRILLEFPSYNLTGFQIDEQLQMELREEFALSLTAREESRFLVATFLKMMI